MTKLTRSYQAAIVSALAASALAAGLRAQGAASAAPPAPGAPVVAQAAVPCPRPANAPALVPVRLDRDGNFRIAPPYVRDSAFTAKPDVPKGRVAAGHVDRRVQSQTMPEAFEWVWKGYKPSGR